MGWRLKPESDERATLPRSEAGLSSCDDKGAALSTFLLRWRTQRGGAVFGAAVLR
jgi:hypothetical protein